MPRPQAIPDLYKRLGITRSASAEDIKRAYRRLVSKYHPDINPEKDAHEQFIAIKEAHDLLSDAEKRKQYHSTGKVPVDSAKNVSGKGFVIHREDAPEIIKNYEQKYKGKSLVKIRDLFDYTTAKAMIEPRVEVIHDKKGNPVKIVIIKILSYNPITGENKMKVTTKKIKDKKKINARF